MPKRQTIAVDIDEVLSPLHDLLFTHHNAKYGTDYPIRDTKGSYYLTDYSGDSHELAMQKIKHYVTSPEFEEIEPLEGAIEVIEWLSLQYDLAAGLLHRADSPLARKTFPRQVQAYLLYGIYLRQRS